MQTKFCNTCKTSLQFFLKTGYLGCPDCYKSFQREIESGIVKIQGSAFHVGKRPRISDENKMLLKEYQRLLSEKEMAGIEGRFNDMAEIAESLRNLLSELMKRGLM
ncbi:MAG: hypothetical protein J6Q32_03275 [Clostridia bacterium]|nr:hypothetical protein [Clostridia bacterium]